jgi:hypothetical protein
MSPQPHPATNSLPLSITQSVLLRDRKTKSIETAAFSFGARTWTAAADSLLSRFSHRRCLYSLEPLEAGDASKKEHVIPQATGTRWIYLPPGLTSDAVNGGMSEHEKELFRKGMLGLFLPWYVTGERSITLADGPVTVEFRNDPKHGFRVKATTPSEAPFFVLDGKEGEPGTVRFPVTVEEANPRSVSLVLHKIAYLALCVFSPNLALSSFFNDTRHYLCENDLGAFRPYAEAFLPGLIDGSAIEPGFRIDWLVRAEETEPGRCKLSSVVASVKIHHVLYTFTLGGPEVPLPRGANVTAFPTSIVPARRRRMLSWAYGAAKHLHPRQSASGPR